MQKSQLLFLSLMAGAVGLSVGCGSGSDGETSTSDLSALNEAASQLAAASGSFAAASTEAQACFETFKACEQSADTSTCHDDLKACLPQRAPMPMGCGGRDADGGSAEPPPAEDGGAAGFGGSPRDGRFDGDGGAPVAADGAADPGTPPWGRGAPRGEPGEHECDGGRPMQGGGLTGGGLTGGGMTPPEPPAVSQTAAALGDARCRPPELPPGAMSACGDQAAAAVAGGQSPNDAARRHHSCVGHSFGDRMEKLCSKAETLCASASAPSDVCTRITQACADFADGGMPEEEADAGEATSADAGM